MLKCLLKVDIFFHAIPIYKRVIIIVGTHCKKKIFLRIWTKLNLNITLSKNIVGYFVQFSVQGRGQQVTKN